MRIPVLCFTLRPVSTLSQRIPETQRRYKIFAKAFMGKALRNATQAARIAGYAENSARQAGAALMSNPAVRRLLRIEAERLARKVEIGPEFVIDELGKLAKANMQDYVDDTGKFVGMDAISRDAAAAIQELTIDTERRSDGRSGAKRKRKTGAASTVTRVRLKLAKKETALELLGKHWNLYGDREGGSQTAVKVIVLNSPRPAGDALLEAKRVAALPDSVDGDVAGESSDVRTEWDGFGGSDVIDTVRSDGPIDDGELPEL